MEAPKFFNNKARAFSSAVLAVSIAACGGNELEKGFHIPTPYSPVPTAPEQNPATVSANVINIDNPPILSGLTLDQNCGILLKPGDKSVITLGNPSGLAVDFEFSLIKDPANGLVLFSLPVEGGHAIAMVDAKNNIFPIGKSTPLGGDEVFFAFFNGRQFKVKDCASDNPALQ